MQSTNKKISYIKNILLVIFIFLLIVSVFYNLDTSSGTDNYEESINILFIGSIVISALIIINIISCLMHLLIASNTIKDVSNESYFIISFELLKDLSSNLNKIRFNKNIYSLFLPSLKFLITPDYFWAEHFKSKLSLFVSHSKFISIYEQDYIRMIKKNYIERCNWLNLSFTVFIVCVFGYLFSGQLNSNCFLTIFTFTFVTSRIVSRTMEILIAFYTDIVVKREKLIFHHDNKYFTINNDINAHLTLKEIKKIEKSVTHYIYSWNNSLLLASARTSLALHSLVEIMIIYSLFYLMLFNVSTYIPSIGFPVGLEEDLGLARFAIYSFSISVTIPELNISNYWAVFQTIQVLLSLVLIIMSIAYYIGKEQKLSLFEKKLYANAKYKQAIRK